jgi:hypothetical protein
MLKRLIIKDIDDLNPAMADYGVILSETHADVEFAPGHNRPVESYLWYNFRLEIQPHTFVEYYREKLAISNDDEAMMSISEWNDELHMEAIAVDDFDRVITVGDIKFGILITEDPTKSIVMMDRMVRYPYQKDINAGSGGYPWQYFDPSVAPSDTELKNNFNLNKYQRDRFRNQW